MNSITLSLEHIRKDFSRRIIFSNIAFTLNNNNSFAVTGRNGSGKSTLVKIIAGILTPTRGSVELVWNKKVLGREQFHNHIGFVAPYLQLYDEFSALENLKFFSKVRGLKFNKEWAEELLNKFSLLPRRDDDVRTYSSGMKQRLKYAFALVHRPEILILDEPRANLDSEGIATVYSIMEEHRKNGILIIATNEQEDLTYADMILNLDELKNQTPVKQQLESVS